MPSDAVGTLLQVGSGRDESGREIWLPSHRFDAPITAVAVGPQSGLATVWLADGSRLEMALPLLTPQAEAPNAGTSIRS